MHASQTMKPLNHKETIKHLILPHELKQEHKTRFNNLKVLKVAHKQFTWNGYEITCMGMYGGHIGKTLV